MNSVKALRSILLATSLGGLAATACVINVGPLDCSECDNDPLCHNHLSGDMCFCDSGYEFANPNDPNDFECDRIPPRPGDSNCNDVNSTQQGDECFCNNGYNWCTNDPADLSCCVDENQDSVGGTGTVPTTTDTPATTTTSETDGSGTDPSAETSDTDAMTTTESDTDDPTGGMNELPACDGSMDFFACTNDDPEDPAGSEAFLCTGGEYQPVDMDAECQFDNFDFAYGCYEVSDTEVAYVCGDGPGTDCTDADDVCADDTNLNICLAGKLTGRNCETFCQEVGMDEITFDSGFCADAACTCCDDDACPA